MLLSKSGALLWVSGESQVQGWVWFPTLASHHRHWAVLRLASFERSDQHLFANSFLGDFSETQLRHSGLDILESKQIPLRAKLCTDSLCVEDSCTKAPSPFFVGGKADLFLKT